MARPPTTSRSPRRRERRHAEPRVHRRVAHVVGPRRRACAPRAGSPPRTGASTPSPRPPRATGRARPRRRGLALAAARADGLDRHDLGLPEQHRAARAEHGDVRRPGALEGARILVRDAAREGLEVRAREVKRRERHERLRAERHRRGRHRREDLRPASRSWPASPCRRAPPRSARHARPCDGARARSARRRRCAPTGPRGA